MPVFLSRNAKRRRKKHGEADGRTVSVTVDGKLVTMAELQSGGVLATEDGSGEGKSKQATTAGHNAHSSYMNAGTEGNDDACLQKENDAADRGASSSGSSSPGKTPQHDEGGATSSTAATNAKGGEPSKAVSKTPSTSPPSSAKDNGSSNNNNPNNINNNKSIGSGGNKHAAIAEDDNNPSLWFGSGNSLKHQAAPTSTGSASEHRRRVPSVNGAADRNLPYKTPQGQKKNFTMYRQGSLTRSRKVTWMNEGFGISSGI
uniref:Uncharacterized protein n=1 Tax=Anopheles maculatus TaxID=74869 RepID=A0A182T148_9DIPT